MLSVRPWPWGNGEAGGKVPTGIRKFVIFLLIFSRKTFFC